ncbi:MAG: sulfate ABC transporter substrate-binding protein [Tepidisphaerales bacterium]
MRWDRSAKRWPAWAGLAVLLLLVVSGVGGGCAPGDAEAGPEDGGRGDRGGGVVRITHVSYDPTRALFRAFNREFAAWWATQRGQRVEIRASHGGSARQARAVNDGLAADVVSLALPVDVDAIARQSGRVSADWRSWFPHNASPFTSSVVFVVRKGNPKGIADWDDLARPGVGVVMANPRTSGGAKVNYFSAWVYGLRRSGGDAAAAEAFVRDVFRNVVVLDTGSRGASTTFAQRRIGDVLVTWENEALLLLREFADRRGLEVEVVVPSLSVLAEPSVAVVEVGVDGGGALRRAVAEAYVGWMFSERGQALAAAHFFRPRDASVAAEVGLPRPAVLVTMEEVFGGWTEGHTVHFGPGGVSERVMSQTGANVRGRGSAGAASAGGGS